MRHLHDFDADIISRLYTDSTFRTKFAAHRYCAIPGGALIEEPTEFNFSVRQANQRLIQMVSTYGMYTAQKLVIMHYGKLKRQQEVFRGKKPKSPAGFRLSALLETELHFCGQDGIPFNPPLKHTYRGSINLAYIQALSNREDIQIELVTFAHTDYPGSPYED